MFYKIREKICIWYKKLKYGLNDKKLSLWYTENTVTACNIGQNTGRLKE